MKKLTIGQRFAIIATFLCLVIAGLSTFAVTRMQNISRVSRSLKVESIDGLRYSGAINAAQAENFITALNVVLAQTADERAAAQEQVRQKAGILTKLIDDYEQTVVTEEDRRNYEALKTQRAEFAKQREQFFALAERDRSAAATMAGTSLRASYEAYSKAGDAIFEYNVRTGVANAEGMIAQVQSDIRVLSVVGLITLGIGAAVTAVTIATVNRVLRRVSGAIDEGAVQVASAAQQVSAASQTLAQGSSEQAASLEETSASLEEVSSMSRRNADGAGQAKTLANQTRAAADGGAEKIGEMKRAMDAIKASSDEISKIIKTIDEIAFQTNILALNAAVEAARAGEAGAGFAVVADEVRNLAQRAAQSAKETATKIEDSMLKSAHGVQISQEVAAALAEIVEKARQVDSFVAEIAQASNEQTQGISQVNSAVAQMDKVTQSNASVAEESAAAAEELNAQATMQREAVTELRALVEGTARSKGAQPNKPAASERTPQRTPVRAHAAAPARVQVKPMRGEIAAVNGRHDEFFKD